MLRLRRRARPNSYPVIVSGGRVNPPSNESLDLLVHFTRSGAIDYVTIYDTLAEEWGERQPSLEVALVEVQDRVRNRPRQSRR